MDVSIHLSLEGRIILGQLSALIDVPYRAIAFMEYKDTKMIDFERRVYSNLTYGILSIFIFVFRFLIYRDYIIVLRDSVRSKQQPLGFRVTVR